MIAETPDKDNDCFVCLDLMWEPSQMPCGHYLCFECLHNALVYKRNCPMCRAEVPKSFKPKIDRDRQKEIRAVQEAEFAKRMQEVKAKRLACDTLTLVYGNTHKIVHSTDHNSHAWTAFVRLTDARLDISKYVKKVVFKLHPTFAEPIIEINSAPFKLPRLGWGTFDIPITVHWQPWLKKGPTKLEHYLSFDGAGESSTEEIKFGMSIYENAEEEFEEEF